MSIYLKLMYDQWIQGQSELEIKERWHVFVGIASKVLHRSEQEIIDELLTTNWFKVDDKSVL